MKLTKTIRKTKELNASQFWTIIESGSGDPSCISNEWHEQAFGKLRQVLAAQMKGYRLITNGYKQVLRVEHGSYRYSLKELITKLVID